MEIYHGEAYKPNGGVGQQFTEMAAVENGQRLGGLLATVDSHYGHILHDVTVAEGARRQGVATQLVGEYVQSLGSQPTKVTGWIFNRETLEVLRDRGIFVQAATEHGHVYLTHREFLDALPIVRMLEAGGLPIKNLWIRRLRYEEETYDPEIVGKMSLRELVDTFMIEFNGETPKR